MTKKLQLRLPLLKWKKKMFIVHHLALFQNPAFDILLTIPPQFLFLYLPLHRVNQISLDPRVCIVRNSNFISGRGTVKVFDELLIFRPIEFI